MDRREVIWQLSRHGHKKEDLELMPIKELSKLFKEETKKNILSYMDFVKDDKADIVQEYSDDNVTREIAKISYCVIGDDINYPMLYDIVEKIFDEYELNETIELVLSQVKDKHYRQMTRIVEVAFRAYQESLLDKLDELCKNYPAEEKFEQLNLYSNKREDVNFLKHAIKKMEEENARLQLSKIAQLKFEIIRDYFPDSLYENYEDYYENDEEKNEIIERIMELTSAYKRPMLKTKKIQLLKHIERVLLEDKEREREEKILIKQFSMKIGDVMNGDDEYAFSRVIKEALDVLDERDVRKIVSNFDLASNPIFLQRFNVIVREHRKVT